MVCTWLKKSVYITILKYWSAQFQENEVNKTALLVAKLKTSLCTANAREFEDKLLKILIIMILAAGLI